MPKFPLANFDKSAGVDIQASHSIFEQVLEDGFDVGLDNAEDVALPAGEQF
ncbi:MAG: hypothetical protein ACXVA9_04780 [Bdellovibrionales bacterium]